MRYRLLLHFFLSFLALSSVFPADADYVQDTATIRARSQGDTRDASRSNRRAVARRCHRATKLPAPGVDRLRGAIRQNHAGATASTSRHPRLGRSTALGRRSLGEPRLDLR